MNIVIDWTTKTIIEYGTNVTGISITQADYGISDSFGNSKYIFNPLTPPNFTPSDITLNPSYLIPAQEASNTSNTISAIISTAQTAVGITLANLTQAEIKALLAILLYKAGAVDTRTSTIKPLNQWT